jgi:hypothetical protein
MKAKYNQKQYTTTRRKLWSIVKKTPYGKKRTKVQWKKVNILGRQLNRMDDWAYKKTGKFFR